MTREEIFDGIHKDCGKLEICNYKETGCGDCPIRVTLIKAQEALEKIEKYEALGSIKELEALKEKNETLKALYENAKKEGNHLISRARTNAIDSFAKEITDKVTAKYCRGDLTSQYIGIQTCKWAKEIAKRMKKE